MAACPESARKFLKSGFPSRTRFSPSSDTASTGKPYSSESAATFGAIARQNGQSGRKKKTMPAFFERERRSLSPSSAALRSNSRWANEACGRRKFSSTSGFPSTADCAASAKAEALSCISRCT